MQNPLPQEYRLVTILTIVVLLSGTIFYHFVEHLSWLDALYFSVITLASVGYGDITPKTPVGKMFTILYVLLGITIVTVFARLLIVRVTERQLERLKKHKNKHKLHDTLKRPEII